MTCEPVVLVEEDVEVVIVEEPQTAIVIVDDESVVLVEGTPQTDVAIVTETEIVVVTTEAEPEVIVVEFGGYVPAVTQYLTDFLIGVVYVGVAPLGAAAADALWRIFKVVEADDHSVKTPTVAGLHAWDDHASLTYA